MEEIKYKIEKFTIIVNFLLLTLDNETIKIAN